MRTKDYTATWNQICQLTENLDIAIGARYDYAKYEFENHLTTFGDIGHGKLSLADRNDEFKHFSPKASLNYHLGVTAVFICVMPIAFVYPQQVAYIT